jgi:hypothetical protein
MNSILASAPGRPLPSSAAPSSRSRRLGLALLAAAAAGLLFVLSGCAALPSDPYPPPVAVKVIQIHKFDPTHDPFDAPSYYVLQRADTGEQWEVAGIPNAQPGEVYQMRL